MNGSGGIDNGRVVLVAVRRPIVTGAAVRSTMTARRRIVKDGDIGPRFVHALGHCLERVGVTVGAVDGGRRRRLGSIRQAMGSRLARRGRRGMAASRRRIVVIVVVRVFRRRRLGRCRGIRLIRQRQVTPNRYCRRRRRLHRTTTTTSSYRRRRRRGR